MFLLFASLAFSMPTYRGQVDASSPYWDVESLYSTSEFQACKARALDRIAATPSDPELYWLAARCQFEIAEGYGRNDPSVDKLAMYDEMLALCDRGLELSPGHPHLHFARSVAVGRIGTTRGVLASLFLAKDVEGSALAAAAPGYTYRSLYGRESLPADAHLVLGIFYRLVPESWVVKVLAGTRGDLALSIEHLEKAHALEPKRVSIAKELGVSRLCYAQRRNDPAMAAQGVAALTVALSIPAEQPTDYIDHRHVRQLLADPSLACGYSRDGQQDVDEAAVAEWENGQAK
jgi:hypothetical protein